MKAVRFLPAAALAACIVFTACSDYVGKEATHPLYAKYTTAKSAKSFREAAESAPQFGDRRSYQMAPDSAPGQALREIALDVEEGADIIMVKPALPYLDIIRMAKDQFPGLPMAAYNVSGEYSMTKAAAANGWIDEKRVVLETLTSIQRAGATIIITYWAKDVAEWLS
ncbi:MAG: hypothetical protein J6X44_10790 [Thermoguttaceae bacterium]|nr:hypothetical protein [Thermoguttaceae bacterium]